MTDIIINGDPIDELILPAILVLNEKGYKTQYSCQGHVDKAFVCDGCKKYGYERCYGYKKLNYKQANAYIKFAEPETLSLIMKYKKVRLPNSYKQEMIDIIRAYFCGTDEEIDKQIKSSAKALLKWAKRLPNKEELDFLLK